MKIIIKDNERGLLFKDGIFISMLNSGKHSINKIFGESLMILKAEGEIKLKDYNIESFFKDKGFEECVCKVDISDGQMAIRYEDGKISEVLQAGRYYFWNIFKKQSFTYINITKPEITEINTNLLASIPIKYYTRIEVLDGFTGLLYFDGILQKKLSAGTYFFWNGSVKVFCNLVDVRIQQIDIAGQEILTADKVSLRMNFICNYKITDPAAITNSYKDYKTQIHVLVQLALREYIGKYKFDELIEQKENIALFVLNCLKEKEEQLYVEFAYCGLKDIVLPGEIREIMNTVLIAEKKAQANVITRREEVASTRSLLNTAKLMEENAILYRLKELEYIEKICDKVGNISVGNGNILRHLEEIVTIKG